jgi:CRP/FNR family transcriptional regulator, cyclic AMP receptor protein
MRTPYGLDTDEDCSACGRQEGCFFCKLSAESLRALDSVKFSSPYPKGAVLFAEGRPSRGVYVLCAGRVKLSACSPDARVIITRIVERGEILGLCSALSGEPYEVTAETLEPCQVTFVRREDFLRLLSGHADASLGAAEQLGRNYRAALEQVRTLGLARTAAAKLARFLLEQSARGVGADADRLRLALTHEEIGQLIGASRETVTRLFSDFKHEQFIQVRGATLLLHDRPALEALANH